MFDRTPLVDAIITNLGDAGAGVARSEIEEVVYGLVGDGITSFPKAAALLAKFPGVSRRVGAVALISVLKARPDIFGAENAPYVRAFNEATETFAEGTGRALADITEDEGRQMAAKVIKASTGDVLVYEGVAHRGDGSCHKWQKIISDWAAAHPDTIKRVGVGKDAKSVTVPGTPFSKITLSLADAMEQGIAPCPACMKKFIAGMDWATPVTPPKPKSFVESLANAEREAFLAYLLAVKKAKGANSVDWRMVERAKTRESFDKDLMRAFLKKEAGQPVSNARLAEFLTVIDVDVDLTVADYAKMMVAGLWDWATGRHELPAWAKRWGKGTLIAFIAVIVLYLAFIGYGAYQFFVNGWYHGRFGGWMGGVSMLLAALIPPYVLWTRKRGLWLNTAGSLLFWGSFGIWIVCHGGGIQQRALLVALAMTTTFVTVALTGLGEWTMLRRRTLFSVYLVSVFALFVGSAAIMGTVESQYRPLEGRKDAGTFVVLTPNPFGLPEFHLVKEVFGEAAAKYELAGRENGRLYSDMPLTPFIKGARARVREDGFGRYTYDWRPIKSAQALAMLDGQGVVKDEILTMPDGRIVPAAAVDGFKEAVGLTTETSENTSSQPAEPSQHMWGRTHLFWVVLVASMVLGGGLALAFLGALEESQSSAGKGLRGMAAFLAVVSLVLGILFGACLGVDRLFGIGEPDQVEESASQPLPPSNGGTAVVAAEPEPPAPPVAPGPAVGRRVVNCARIHDPVNHETCVRAMSRR